jgi:hypothetical protein
MKKSTIIWSMAILLLTVGMLSAQTVNVTFRVNTATVPDTVTPNSAVVQVRGGTAPLTWGNDTGGQLVNVGGDYWEVTLAFPTNTAIAYKFFANASGDGTGDGWEANVNTGSTNRELTTTTSDTVLPVKFFNKINGAGEDDLPFTPSDSMDVWFRVNVHRLIQYNEFDPATQVMGIRGGTPTLDWGNTIVLEPETPHQGGQFTYPSDYFWSGQVKIVPTAINPGDTIFYKFVYGDAPAGNNNIEWESLADNRILPVTVGLSDTSQIWAYWDNEPPDVATGQDTVTVKFVADLTRAINENGFSPGDTIYAQYGDNGTSDPDSVKLTKEGIFGNIYTGTKEITSVQAGGELQYNYYVTFNGVGYRENYFDFNDPIFGSRQEKRKLNIPSPVPGTTIETADTVVSVTASNRQPQFQNRSVLPKEVTVRWEVDLRPPYYQILLEGDTLFDGQGTIHVGPAQLDSIFTTWGVWINGLAVDGWTGWGSDLRNAPGKKMWDDGTNGDDAVANDSIYTTTWFYDGPDSSDIVGQVFKFGIYGGDNEGGFGNNHLENIVLQNPGNPTPETITIFSQFGSIDPLFYWRWNFDLGIVGIDDEGAMQITKTPRLDPNYPNPFNPVTSIRFVLPKAMDVKIEIFNSLGQKVTTLVDGKRVQGQHIINWNGIDSRGIPVSSGIYFYRLSAENYERTMKMILMK